MTDIPQWLVSDYAKTESQFQRGVLPHGLMIVGHPGHGSNEFASQLGAKILCSDVNASGPCGQCKSCMLLASGHHPDYLRVEPEGKSLTIKVDAVRSIVQKVTATAQQGGNKVVHIESSEKMNVNAANALLKVLEEPTNNTFILLETAELSRLLPTLRSRCRIQYLTKPTLQDSVEFLNSKGFTGNAIEALSITNNSPLLASKLTSEDIQVWQKRVEEFSSPKGFVGLSSFINKQDMSSTLQQVLSWVDATIRLKQGIKSDQEVQPVSVSSALQSVDLVSLFSFRDYILDKVSAINRQANLNPQLMAEELASKWLSLRGIQ